MFDIVLRHMFVCIEGFNKVDNVFQTCSSCVSARWGFGDLRFEMQEIVLEGEQ